MRIKLVPNNLTCGGVGGVGGVGGGDLTWAYYRQEKEKLIL